MDRIKGLLSVRPGAGNSYDPGKRLIPKGDPVGRSDQGESFSAFGSAAFEDQTAPAGGHSGAESALMRSFDVRRLKRSFHLGFPFPGLDPTGISVTVFYKIAKR